MNWKKMAVDYFSFSRRDRIGVLSLIVIILILTFIPAFFARKQPPPAFGELASLDSTKRADTYQGYQNKSPSQYSKYKKQWNYNPDTRFKARGELFKFDPNSISTADWQRLGLREKTIAIIQNYLAKGGKFRKPEDLERIYGLFPDEYERLRPYVRIENLMPFPNSYHNTYDQKQKPPVEKRSYKSFPIVEINAADTTALIALPGIGSKLAARIISFRNKLGGFYAVEQIGETFGLADSVFQKIKQYLIIESIGLKKLNLNTATVEELKSHPYIRYAIANAIISYRNEHRSFKKVSDLENILILSKDAYLKMKAYLFVDGEKY